MKVTFYFLISVWLSPFLAGAEELDKHPMVEESTRPVSQMGSTYKYLYTDGEKEQSFVWNSDNEERLLSTFFWVGLGLFGVVGSLAGTVLIVVMTLTGVGLLLIPWTLLFGALFQILFLVEFSSVLIGLVILYATLEIVRKRDGERAKRSQY